MKIDFNRNSVWDVVLWHGDIQTLVWDSCRLDQFLGLGRAVDQAENKQQVFRMDLHQIEMTVFILLGKPQLGRERNTQPECKLRRLDVWDLGSGLNLSQIPVQSS